MLSTHNLQLRISTRDAQRLLVDDLNWRVLPAQCWCVIGRNGSGKSTLLRSLAGLRQPDAGSIAIGGRALADWPLAALARERAFLPQSRHDAFAYRVIETVLSARHPYHVDNASPADGYWEGSGEYQAAHAALQAMDVAELAERDIRTLSGGERQRVAIATLLAQDTPLMLLDEPANALDLAHQVGVAGLLARLCREQGKAVVMVGHDLNLAHSVASHVLLLMGDGRWQAGPVAEVMQAAILGRCLGHPIKAVTHGARTIFIPA